jgi:hypothetical protein
MQADYVGWAIGIVGIAVAVWAEVRARHRRDVAHAGLVSLKPAIQGANRDEVIAAINDLLTKIK